MLTETIAAVRVLTEKLERNNEFIRSAHLLPFMRRDTLAESESLAFTINLLNSQILVNENSIGEALRRSIFVGKGFSGVRAFDLKEGFEPIKEGEIHSYEGYVKEHLVHPNIYCNADTTEFVAWCSINPILVVGVNDFLLINADARNQTGWQLVRSPEEAYIEN